MSTRLPRMTVGELRDVLENIPDDTPISLRRSDGCADSRRLMVSYVMGGVESPQDDYAVLWSLPTERNFQEWD